MLFSFTQAFHFIFSFCHSSRLETQNCDQFTMDYLSALFFHESNKIVLYSFTKSAIEYKSNDKLLEKRGGGNFYKNPHHVLNKSFHGS